jgi:hypothetical protein
MYVAMNVTKKEFDNECQGTAEKRGYTVHPRDVDNMQDPVKFAALKPYWESSNPNMWSEECSQMEVKTDEELHATLGLMASKGRQDRILVYFYGA